MSQQQDAGGLQPRVCASVRRTRQELRQARANVATLDLLDRLGVLQDRPGEDLVAREQERHDALRASLDALADGRAVR